MEKLPHRAAKTGIWIMWINERMHVTLQIVPICDVVFWCKLISIDQVSFLVISLLFRSYYLYFFDKNVCVALLLLLSNICCAVYRYSGLGLQRLEFHWPHILQSLQLWADPEWNSNFRVFKLFSMHNILRIEIFLKNRINRRGVNTGVSNNAIFIRLAQSSEFTVYYAS